MFRSIGTILDSDPVLNKDQISMLIVNFWRDDRIIVDRNSLLTMIQHLQGPDKIHHWTIEQVKFNYWSLLLGYKTCQCPHHDAAFIDSLVKRMEKEFAPSLIQ